MIKFAINNHFRILWPVVKLNFTCNPKTKAKTINEYMAG